MDISLLNEPMRMQMLRLGDMVQSAQHKYDARFSSFLDAAAVACAKSYLQAEDGFSFAFYGGYEDAERCMFGIWPSYATEDALEKLFPIALLRIDFPVYQQLTHRDCLGALLGLGIKREMIGDILCDAQTFYVFVSAKMKAYILENLQKIGSLGVRVDEVAIHSFLAPEVKTESKGIFVMSNRLDAVLAGVLDLSRTRASEYIRTERICVNHILQTQTDAKITEGDVLSVRGCGRFKIGKAGNKSRKGRTYLEIIKYI